ncbi:MAG: PilZ domain-containing protein [Halanaerobacter sp.]
MADFNLYLGQEVKLTPANNSDIEYQAQVISKDDINLNLRLLNATSEDSSVFKEEKNWTLNYEESNAFYQLDIEVKKIRTKAGPVLAVTVLGEERKKERRRYIRVKVDKQVNYHLLNKKESYQGRLIDISASGMNLEVENISSLRVEKIIVINFADLAEFPMDEVEGRILRIKVNQNSHGSRRKYHLGLEFVSITAPEKEKLILWVQQRKDGSN